MSSQPLAYLSSPGLSTCVEACIIWSLDIPAPLLVQVLLLLRHPLNSLTNDFENVKLKLPADL